MSYFSQKDTDLQNFHHRARLSIMGVALCFFLLFVRLFYLQVAQKEYYATRAESNRISLVPIVPNRGNIEDRNGVILARNYSAFTLEITPSEALDIEGTIEALSKIIDIQAKDIRRFKTLAKESRNFESLPIRTRLSDEEVARFAANHYRFPGVEIKARLFRQYPEGALAAHAIGYISRINDQDLEWIQQEEEKAERPINYVGTELIGKTGLEKNYEFELHGITGYEQVEVDKNGNAVRVLTRSAPVSGNNLVLTLDTGLQKMAETIFGGRRGSLVALDPRNGAVLALFSSPSFDPNLFIDGIRFEDWNQLNDNPDTPMLNRAIYSAHPPGSTFKPLMAMAALTYGKRSPAQLMADPGYFVFGDHRFMDDKVGGHGMVDMRKSIVVSCNTYYYQLAADMGIDNIARFMRDLGLGSRTGIDIPGESEGILPSPEWKQKYFKKQAQQKWFAGETISVGIGQGYNAYTTLQMAHALSNILNYGKVYPPHLVAAIKDTGTGGLRQIGAAPVRQIALKPEHVDFIKKAMRDVNKEGTGARAFAGAPYESGGKTGTAQVFSLKGQRYAGGRLKEKLRDHSWFIAFAPVEEPRVVLALMVENGGFGAQSAAPIARSLLDYYLLGKVPAGSAPEIAASENTGHEEGEDD